MKKVYEIRKYVVANNIKQALRLEKLQEVSEIYLTNHSANLLLDSLHSKNAI